MRLKHCAALAVLALGSITPSPLPVGRAGAARIAVQRVNKGATVTVPAVRLDPPAPQTKMYAYYYLWWSSAHWESKLGPNYPSTSPLPLPATLGSGECNPQSLYTGNELTDVPRAIYSQDTPGVIENHVRQAAAAHLAGFIVNWKGTGLIGQTTADVSYSRRLAELARAVAEVNAEGIPFKIILNYEVSQAPTLQEMTNDWAYLERTYAKSPVLERFGTPRPLLIWSATKDYSVDVLREMANRFRGSFFMIGSESGTTWTAERGAFLDGDTQYWSSQDPYTNASSFDQLANLAATVRASGPNPDGTAKMWMSPIAPGYDHILGGGSSCVARNNGETLRRLFAGNSRSSPDAWALISWNEITEGSYVEPLTRWGDLYLKSISALLTTP